ncbi:unnamed protein product [Laminaria digitata]
MEEPYPPVHPHRRCTLPRPDVPREHAGQIPQWLPWWTGPVKVDVHFKGRARRRPVLRQHHKPHQQKALWRTSCQLSARATRRSPPKPALKRTERKNPSQTSSSTTLAQTTTASWRPW